MTCLPPQFTVEKLIERLKNMEVSKNDDGEGLKEKDTSLVPISAASIVQSVQPPFRGHPEEVEYLTHCLEEKQKTNFIITKLENKVESIKEELDQERRLHMETITFLGNVYPGCMRTMLNEKTRLRAAIQDGFMENLKSENEKLKKTHDDLLIAFASRIQKFESEIKEKDQKILGLEGCLKVKFDGLVEENPVFKAILDHFSSSGRSEEIQTLRDYHRVSEFELKQKNLEISDLEEQRREMKQKIEKLETLKTENSSLKTEIQTMESKICKIQKEKLKQEKKFEFLLMQKESEIEDLELIAQEGGECSWSTLNPSDFEGVEDVIPGWSGVKEEEKKKKKKEKKEKEEEEKMQEVD